MNHVKICEQSNQRQRDIKSKEQKNGEMKKLPIKILKEIGLYSQVDSNTCIETNILNKEFKTQLQEVETVPNQHVIGKVDDKVENSDIDKESNSFDKLKAFRYKSSVDFCNCNVYNYINSNVGNGPRHETLFMRLIMLNQLRKRLSLN